MKRHVPRLVALVLALYPAGVGVQERYISETVSGNHANLGVTYSTQLYSDGNAVVDVTFNGKRVLANINYRQEALRLRSFSATGQAARITRQDRDVIYRVYPLLPQDYSLANDATVSVLNILAEHPLDVLLLDIDVAKNQGKAWTSLCQMIGRPVTGRYDVGKNTFTELVVCGPCGSGDCLGRCGPGCRFAPAAAIQRFTQECLNHDLCAGKTGDYRRECADEFNAAILGFTFATDCAMLTGRWTDNYGFVWSIVESGGSLRGTVITRNCGTWNVTGSRRNFAATLTARIRRRQTGCTTAFTYTGDVRCNRGSGTWTNASGAKGSWSMTRQTYAQRTGPELPTPDVEEDGKPSQDPSRDGK